MGIVAKITAEKLMENYSRCSVLGQSYITHATVHILV
jgi:hypothetical protein